MSESEEKYLKTVFTLEKDHDEVRSIDVACTLGYSRASVCRAMKILKENEYITMDSYGRISLTQVGFIKAKSIYERESIISEFLKQTLAIDDELSAKYSAYVAHIIEPDTLNKIKNEMKTAI
nr:metal-dependent transcriptional regulator [uncultured Aminipila sp.]